MILKCVKCGGAWHSDHANQWGETQESDGYGPHTRCTNLVPAKGAPLALSAVQQPDGSYFEKPLAVCGGQLASESVRDSDVLEAVIATTWAKSGEPARAELTYNGQVIRQVTPIIPNRAR